MAVFPLQPNHMYQFSGTGRFSQRDGSNRAVMQVDSQVAIRTNLETRVTDYPLFPDQTVGLRLSLFEVDGDFGIPRWDGDVQIVLPTGEVFMGSLVNVHRDPEGGGAGTVAWANGSLASVSFTKQGTLGVSIIIGDIPGQTS